MSQRICETCGGAEFRLLFTRNRHDFFRCKSCRLVRIDPQPTDEVLSAIYGGSYFEAWGGAKGCQECVATKEGHFSPTRPQCC
jgi:hypothetical protein